MNEQFVNLTKKVIDFANAKSMKKGWVVTDSEFFIKCSEFDVARATGFKYIFFVIKEGDEYDITVYQS